VSGDLNPADDLSWGLSAEALLSSDRWIKGPAFLCMEQKAKSGGHRVLCHWAVFLTKILK